jgi:hypothetical protein
VIIGIQLLTAIDRFVCGIEDLASALRSPSPDRITAIVYLFQ